MRVINLVPKTNGNINSFNKNKLRYNDLVSRKVPVFVKFHSPSCPHCHDIKKSWNNVPRYLNKMGYNTRNFNMASIDTDVLEEEDINGWKDVYGVPTIAKVTGNRAKQFQDDATDTVNIVHFIVEEYKLPKIRNTFNRFNRSYLGGKKKKRYTKKRR